MVIVKRLVSILGLMTACSLAQAIISLDGPFSEESRKLLEDAKTNQKNPTLEALRYFKSLLQFHSDFRELSQPKANAVLKPGIAEPTLEAIVQIIENNKPEHALGYSDPYSSKKDYKLLLAKIALMTHRKDLLQDLITHSANHFEKDAFFMTLYEAQPNDLEIAKEFIQILSKAVPIDSIDEIGFTPLAVTAVNKASPTLTNFILMFKPNINFVMTNLFPGKLYSNPLPRGHGLSRDIISMTVLELVNNALANKKDTATLKDLEEIKAMLTKAGAKPVDIWVWE